MASKRKLTYEQEDKEPPGNSLDYNPVHFLRAHSRNEDEADVRTQVWQCAFEPDPYNSKKNTDVVATCGGCSVAFINIVSGESVGRYCDKDKRDVFFTLCWTTMHNWARRNHVNVLAVGGARCTIHVMDPWRQVAFLRLRLRVMSTRSCAITCLLFHPAQPSMLLCATNSGCVSLLDLGCPQPPDYQPQLLQLREVSCGSEIISMIWSGDSGVLLAGSATGLYGWRLTSRELRQEEDGDSMPLLEFDLPEHPGVPKPYLVDSVEVIGNGYVATKCALTTCIFVWNLQDTLQIPSNDGKVVFPVVPTYVLEWSKTSNYFMHMGYNHYSGLLACGDDRGALWLYDMHAILNSCPSSLSSSHKAMHKPSLVLDWPVLKDVYSEKKQKLSLDCYDIVIDKVIVSHNGCHLVAVTDNNMVCIWKRVQS